MDDMKRSGIQQSDSTNPFRSPSNHSIGAIPTFIYPLDACRWNFTCRLSSNSDALPHPSTNTIPHPSQHLEQELKNAQAQCSLCTRCNRPHPAPCLHKTKTRVEHSIPPAFMSFQVNPTNFQFRNIVDLKWILSDTPTALSLQLCIVAKSLPSFNILHQICQETINSRPQPLQVTAVVTLSTCNQ